MHKITAIARSTISLKGFLVILMSLSAAAFAVSFGILGPNRLFDWQTLLLSLALVSFLGFVTGASNAHLFVQHVAMAVFFLIFVIPRLFMYLVIPGIVQFPFETAITNTQINVALLYLLVGTACISAGFLIAEKLFGRIGTSSGEGEHPARYSTAVILAVFVITVLVVCYIQVILGVSYLTQSHSGVTNAIIQLALLVFNIDTVFFMSCATLLCTQATGKKALFAAVFIIAAYFMVMSLQGSRSVGLRIALVIFMILLCKKINLKLRLSHFGVFLAILCIGYIAYPLATQKRIDTVTRKNSLIAYTSSGISLYRDNSRLIAIVLNRMGLVDYEIMMLTQAAESQAKAKFMNMAYAGKSIANLLVPGTVFPDATINTSRFIPVLYRGFSEDYLKKSGYFSEFYTAWGIMFLLFGWWGGWLMLMIAGMCIHLLYLFIMRFGKKYRYHIGALCLFTVGQLFYANMGIDHWIVNSVLILASGVIALGLFGLGDFFLRMAHGTR